MYRFINWCVFCKDLRKITGKLRQMLFFPLYINKMSNFTGTYTDTHLASHFDVHTFGLFVCFDVFQVLPKWKINICVGAKL